MLHLKFSKRETKTKKLNSEWLRQWQIKLISTVSKETWSRWFGSPECKPAWNLKCLVLLSKAIFKAHLALFGNGIVFLLILEPVPQSFGVFFLLKVKKRNQAENKRCLCGFKRRPCQTLESMRCERIECHLCHNLKKKYKSSIYLLFLNFGGDFGSN